MKGGFAVESSDADHYRAQLFALRNDLQEAARADDESTRPVELDQTRQGRLSRMDAMQAQQMAQAVVRRREQQLRRVEGALMRIESGDFGYCFKCDEAISRKRLDADPTITRCLECMEE